MQLHRLPRAMLRGSQLAPPALSPTARTRLQALEVWQQTGHWRLAARVFGLSRATLFRWLPGSLASPARRCFAGADAISPRI